MMCLHLLSSFALKWVLALKGVRVPVSIDILTNDAQAMRPTCRQVNLDLRARLRWSHPSAVVCCDVKQIRLESGSLKLFPKMVQTIHTCRHADFCPDKLPT